MTSVETPPATSLPTMNAERRVPPESTPAATVRRPTSSRGHAGAVIGRPAEPALARLPMLASRAAAEHVPLHAELAAGLARGLDEAHLQHDLLRRHHLDRVDDLGPNCLRDRSPPCRAWRRRARCRRA